MKGPRGPIFPEHCFLEASYSGQFLEASFWRPVWEAATNAPQAVMSSPQVARCRSLARWLIFCAGITASPECVTLMQLLCPPISVYFGVSREIFVTTEM